MRGIFLAWFKTSELSELTFIGKTPDKADLKYYVTLSNQEHMYCKNIEVSLSLIE